MTESREVRPEELEHHIKKKIPIPARWKEHMLHEFKRQVNLLEEFSEISSIIHAWQWTLRPHNFLWKVIEYLDIHPAATAYTLATDILFDDGRDFEGVEKSEVNRLSSKVRYILQKLNRCGLLTTYRMGTDEIGSDRYGPTIYLTHWAKDHHLEDLKRFYIDLGGWKGKTDKKRSKTIKQLSQHNLKVKAYTDLSNFKIGAQLYNFYKCPNGHNEGLLRIRKPTPRTKEALTIHKCKICRKDLDEILYEEFMKRKEKELLNYYGVKN